MLKLILQLIAKDNDLRNKAKQALRLSLRFLRVKKNLLLKLHFKKKFPYDEYSSYL